MKKKLIILFSFGLLLVALERVGVFKRFEESLAGLTRPVQVSFYAGSHAIANQFSVIFDIGNLRSKNDSLSQRVAILEAENGRLKKLENENNLLRDELGLTKETQVKLIEAAVLGYTPALTRGFITIDKGNSTGVKKNQIVIVKNILLGSVSEVRENSSTIRLLSDPESKVLGETGSKAKGVVVGDFGSRIKLTKILLEDRLTVGELVYSSGEENFPKGLVVGKISKINRLEAELFQEAELTPMLDVSKLDTVFIEKQ